MPRQKGALEKGSTMAHRIVPALLLALCAVAALGQVPPAAQSCLPVAFVEPDQGNDATGTFNDPLRPFKTIEIAMSAMSSSDSEVALACIVPCERSPAR